VSDARRSLIEAETLQTAAVRGSRVAAVTIAVIAVLAALGTLLAHHRSIASLAEKNEAVLSQARASDAFAKYEAKQIRYQIAHVMAESGISRTPADRRTVEALFERERADSNALLARAEALETSSEQDDVRSQGMLRSYETLQTGTMFFEVAIVLVSIATLARAGWFLSLGYGLSAVGIVMLAIGLAQAAR
jgi:hypothetical protein